MMFLASIIIGLSTGGIYGEPYGWLAFGISLLIRSIVLRITHKDDEDYEGE